ncbi:MAG TPA: adenylate/guanylate cyclase domain-containing protein [Nannocystis sp.]|jgi:adenylate cyclase
MRDAADIEVNPAHCRVCGAALAGSLAYVSMLLGVRRSARNPNLCNRCTAHMKDGESVEITALFADLSGFTGLTQSHGDEQTAEIVDAFLRGASRAIQRQDGVVDKFIGDAVMAVFNAPIRREDHCRRAVAAAIDIQNMMAALTRRFGVELQVSIGVARGTARLGRVGSDDVSSFTAIGGAVNLASRLQGAARPGTIAVDSAALADVADVFPDARTQATTLKGFEAPVAVAALHASTAAAEALRAAPSLIDRGRTIGRAAALMAALGAPCAGFYLFSPIVYALGFGAVFQSALFLTIDTFLDDGPARTVLSSLAILSAAITLAMVVRVRLKRRRARQTASPGERMQERRLLFAAGLALAVVGLEHWVHLVSYHKGMWAAH